MSTANSFKMKKPPFRIWIGVMIFFTTFQIHMFEVNMSISISAMTVPKNGTRIIYKSTQCKKSRYNASVFKYTTAENVEGRFNCTKFNTRAILQAYYYGHSVTVLVGGTISEWIGPFRVIFWTSLGSAVITGFTPLVADYSQATGVKVARVLTGMFGGPVYPALYVLIARWVPPKEKGKFLAAMSGSNLGKVFTWYVVGAFRSKMWRWGFYILVITTAVYLAAFFILVSDTPDESQFVSQEERDYITECQQKHVSLEEELPPLISIFLSPPFWAIVCAEFGNLWCLMVMPFLPIYMNQTLGFNFRSAAGLASLPHLTRLVTSLTFGIIGDWVTKKGFMALTWQRKFFIIFSHFIPAACLILIYPAGCASVAVVTLFILNQGFNGAVVVSHLISPQDLSPNFAGTLYGLVNFIGGLTRYFVIQLSAAFFKDYKKDKIKAGGIVFGLAGVALIVGGIIFIIFGSAEVQPWNEIEEEDPQQPEEENVEDGNSFATAVRKLLHW